MIKCWVIRSHFSAFAHRYAVLNRSLATRFQALSAPHSVRRKWLAPGPTKSSIGSRLNRRKQGKNETSSLAPAAKTSSDSERGDSDPKRANGRIRRSGLCWPTRLVRSTAFRKWRGLNRRLFEGKSRLPPRRVQAFSTLRSEILGIVIRTYLDRGNVEGSVRAIGEAVKLWSFEVNEKVAVRVLNGVVAEAKKRKLELFGGAPTDVAVETVEKMVEEWNLRVGQEVLAAVVRIARESPGERAVSLAMSMLRWSENLGMRLTWVLAKQCFDACIEGLDLTRAAILVSVMRERQLLGTGATRIAKEVELYREVLEVTVKNGQVEATEMIFKEMRDLGIGMDDVGVLSAMAAFWINTGKEEEACKTMEAIRSEGRYPSDLAYMAMMKLEGRRKRVNAIACLLEEAEEKWSRLEGDGVLHKEVVKAAFDAYRTAAAGTDALEQLDRLASQYGYRPSMDIYSLIIETCWRSNMLDVAIKLRREVQKLRRRSTRLTTDQKRKLKESGKDDN